MKMLVLVLLSLFSTQVIATTLLCSGEELTVYRHKGAEPQSEKKSATLTLKVKNSELEDFSSCQSDATFIRCNTCKFFSQKHEDCLKDQRGSGQRMKWEVVLNRISGEVKSTSILDIYSQGLASTTFFSGKCEIAKPKF